MISNKTNFEKYLASLCILASVPLLILIMVLQLSFDVSIWIVLLTLLFSTLLVTWCSFRIYNLTAYQFRNLHNLLDAMNEGDFSLRMHSQTESGAYSDLIKVINNFSSTLSQQRLKTAESQLLLQTVIEQIDVAIVAVDQNDNPEPLNPKAISLFEIGQNKQELKALLGKGSTTCDKNNLITLEINGRHHKFRWLRESFRRGGAPQQLFFFTDVEHLLREEEVNAWQKLVRVISHEINNSLAPICSISQMLSKQVELHLKGITPYDNLTDGLKLISDRASSLTNFINSYQQLSKLPPPSLNKQSLLSLLDKTARLFENNRQITINVSHDLIVDFDPVQIEQVMINLLKNASEAMTNNSKEDVIEVTCSQTEHSVTVSILDSGVGLQNSENLFVPFYSTKAHGSGIGLVLCRHIIEAHGGQLTLESRQNRTGCQASFTLPK